MVFESRNKIILCAVVLIVVITAVFMIVVLSSRINCELSEDEPTYDFTKGPVFFKSKDNKALVQFAGYLKYIKKENDEDAEKVYLPLNLQNIKLTSGGVNWSSYKSLTLTTDCASIEYKLFRDINDYLAVESIHVELRLANGEIKSCDIADTGISIPVPPGSHYKCVSGLVYSCDARTKDKDNKDVIINVAKLSVNYLEYEIDGDPEKIKNNKYSTKETDYC